MIENNAPWRRSITRSKGQRSRIRRSTATRWGARCLRRHEADPNAGSKPPCETMDGCARSTFFAPRECHLRLWRYGCTGDSPIATHSILDGLHPARCAIAKFDCSACRCRLNRRIARCRIASAAFSARGHPRDQSRVPAMRSASLRKSLRAANRREHAAAGQQGKHPRRSKAAGRGYHPFLPWL